MATTFCLDYQPAVAQGAGIGRYTRQLAANLLPALAPDERLRLFFCDFRRKAPADPVPGAEARAFRLLPGALMQKAWSKLGRPAFDRLSGPADVFHFTNFVSRPVRRGRVAVSIHDMSFERFPAFAEERNRAYLHANVGPAAGRADAILTDSEFSKREIEELLPAARGKVHATPLGIAPDFRPAPPARVAEVRAALGLPRPFLLHVGTVEPRKNLPFLVDVWEKLAAEGVDLVVAGAPGWRCEPIFARFAEAEKRLPGRFRYVRYVPDGMLDALYSAAALFAIPSHYEGFGFPPLEAMACGTPVLSSDGGSLPEVLGGAAEILHGFDADGWAGAALRLLREDPAARAARVAAGRARAASFTWERCARETLAVYRKLLG
ncbi:MAG: glycosyltransferase family 4 protein [Kiritimatiellae bacterium]|nr:glycosyltransferase family 4 protein [Kiritimatiellia bacterium]